MVGARRCCWTVVGGCLDVVCVVLLVGVVVWGRRVTRSGSVGGSIGGVGGEGGSIGRKGRMGVREGVGGVGGTEVIGGAVTAISAGVGEVVAEAVEGSAAGNLVRLAEHISGEDFAVLGRIDQPLSLTNIRRWRRMTMVRFTCLRHTTQQKISNGPSDSVHK